MLIEVTCMCGFQALYVPALTNAAWSSEIVGQTLEGLFVCLRPDGAHQLRPIHAPTLRLGC